MPLAEASVPFKQGCWSPGPHEDEVPFKTFLCDGRSAFERSEDGTLGLRKSERGLNERVDDQRGIDCNQELFKASVVKRRDGNRFAIIGEVRQLLRRYEIDLVQNPG